MDERMKEWNETLVAGERTYTPQEVVVMVQTLVFHNATPDDGPERTERLVRALEALGFDVGRGTITHDGAGWVVSGWSFKFRQ